MTYVFVLNQTMEGRVVPYLKEVRLASNLPRYVRTLLRIYMRPCYTRVDAMCRCTKVTSLFRLATSNVTVHGQLRRHQVIVH